MSVFDQFKDKASQAAQGALHDEATTDTALDKARDLANERTGGKYADQLNKARDMADDRVGDNREHPQDPAEGSDPAQPAAPAQPEEHAEAPAEG